MHTPGPWAAAGEGKGEKPEPRDKNGHVLMTSKTCTFGESTHNYGTCPVCDGGLGICVLCGRAEIELDEPCTGKRAVTKEAKPNA